MRGRTCVRSVLARSLSRSCSRGTLVSNHLILPHLAVCMPSSPFPPPPPSALCPLVSLSYASLAHGMDRGMAWGSLLAGGRIAFAASDYLRSHGPAYAAPATTGKEEAQFESVLAAARAAGTTIFASFPRMFESVRRWAMHL